MSGHETEIRDIPHLPCLVWEDEPSSTYGTPLGSDHSIAGTSPDDPSQFLGYMNHRYWLRSLNLDTHHAPTSTSTIRYGMPDLPMTGLTPNFRSGVDPSISPGGTSIPF